MNSLPVIDFRALFETLPGLYLILNPDLTIIAASDAYLKATLTERTSILGLGLFEVFPDNPHDKEATGVSNLRTSLNAVLQLGKPHKMTVQKYDIRKPDGVFEERYWSPLNSPVFNEAHELVYIIHNVVDVTDQQKESEKLKKSEQDYQLLISSVKDYAIFMVDPSGLVASWNSGAASIKGYTAAEIIGQSITVFYTAEDIQQGLPQSNLAMALQEGHFEAEGWRLRKDGSLFWANIVITALKDEAGILYGYSKITRDITERKKSREQLELLSRQINQSNDAIFTTDDERKIKSWNLGAQNLYGFTAAEALGKESHLLLRSALQTVEIDALLVEIAAKDYWSGELRRKTKAGKDIYVFSSVTTLRNDIGIISGYVAVSFDVTAQKKLREQVNHLASIVEQSSEAIISRGLDQRMISWNSGAERLFGYSKAEAIGKTPRELQFTGLGEKEMAEIGQQVIEKGNWHSERQFFHKNGSSFFGTVSANPVKNEQQEIASMVFIIKDISLRKQLEEQLKKYNAALEIEVKARTEDIIKGEKRFRALIENSNDVVSLMDESFKILYRSPSTFRITGWPDEEMLNTDGIKNIHPDDIDKAKGIVKELLANPGRPINCLFRNLHKEGHYLWMEGVVINLLQDEYVKAIVFNFRDVTERVAAEEKLITSESRFRALVENNYDIISLIDESFNIIYRSPSVTRVMGFETGEMKHMEGIENVHPDDRANAAALIREAIAHPGKSLSALFRRQHKNGHYVWLEGKVTNLLHDTQVKAIVTNFRDITERLEAEEKLLASEKFFRALIENSNDIITLMDDAFKLSYRSPAAARLTGWTNEDMIGIDATKNIHPGDQLYTAAIITEVMANPGKTISSKFRMRHKNGHYLWVEGTLTNLLHDKNVKAIVFNFRDVTERIKAEEKLIASEMRFRTLIENNSDLIVLTNASFKIIYRSPSAARITGWPDEEMKGIALTQKIHPGDRKKIARIYEACMANPGKHVNISYRINNKSGACLHMEGIMTNLLHEEHVNAIVLNLRDVTERIEAEAKLIASEMRFRLLIENSADGIDLSDEFSNNIYRSPGAIKITGMLPKENQRGFTHPDDRETIKNLQEEFIKKPGVPVAFQARFRHALGHYIWVEGTVTNLLHVEGVDAFVTNFRDITQRKQAEQEKEFDAHNLDALINNTHDLMWSVDRDYKLITSNNAFNTLMTSITGKIPEKGNSIFLEEFDKPLLERYRRYYKRAFAGETFSEIERDSSSIGDFWSEISFYPIYEGTVVIGTACFSRNITDKKRAEQELKKSFFEKQALAERMSIILNTLPANIALLDEKGCIMEVNDSWRNFADENGFTGINYCIGDNYIGISKKAFGEEKEDGKKVADGIKAVLKNKLKEFVFEYSCDAPSIKRWFRMVATPLREQEYAGAVVMHIDISELRFLEQERLLADIEAQKKITKAILIGQEKERNHIGQELHDNINQILAGTKIYLSIAGKKNKDVLELIKYPMELLDSSIEEIRLLCQKMVTPLKNVRLEELIRDLLNKIDKAKKIKTEFVYDVTDGTLSDDLQLNIYRIIQELVNNVLKYADAKKVKISVSTANGIINVIVTDDGKGFDPDKKRNGIGISNMINRVGSFNGKIIIESAIGHGCKTSIHIPSKS